MNSSTVCAMSLCILKGYLEGFESTALYPWLPFKKAVKLFIYEPAKAFNILIRK